jgi:predicted GH43/DUF377 family glycosyl hydrolase
MLIILLFGIVLPHGSAAVQGQLVLDVGKGWDASGVGFPSVIYNGSSFMMWYEGASPKGEAIGLATSNDGISWTRYAHNPVFNGSRGEQWDSNDVFLPYVIFEDGVYKMWYTGDGYSSGNPEQIGYATSPDGITWTRYSSNPVLGPSSMSWDAFQVYGATVVHAGSSYIMYFHGQENSTPSQGMFLSEYGMAASEDGIHWTQTRKAIVPVIPTNGWDAKRIMQQLGSVSYSNGMFVAVYSGENGSEENAGENNTGAIGVATSTDGVHWTPFGGNPIVTPSGNFSSWNWNGWGGDWSPDMVAVGNHYYVYYTGEGVNSQDESMDRIGLAILPTSSLQLPEFPFAQAIFLTTTIALVLCLRRKNGISDFLRVR